MGKDIGAVMDDQGACIVIVADEEDRNVAIENIRTVCRSLGYTIVELDEWCSLRASPARVALAETPATCVRHRSRYFAHEQRDKQRDTEKSERRADTDSSGFILRMGLAAGPARLDDDDLGGGWRASSTRDVVRRQKRVS